MPYVTAAKNPATYAPLAIHGAEGTLDEIQDVAAKELATLAVLEQVGILEETDLPYATVLPMVTVNDVPSTPITYGSTPPIVFGTGLSAQRHEFALSVAPVAIDWAELCRTQSGDEAMSFGRHRMYLALQSLGNSLEVDVWAGQASNALRIFGWEQFIFNEDAVLAAATTTSALQADRWRFQQCANTVGGIARSAWTSATTGGTGLESISLNLDQVGLASGSRQFAISSALPNAVWQLMIHLYNHASRGAARPDVLFMSNLPYEDTCNMGQNFVQIFRQNGEGGAKSKTDFSVGYVSVLDAQVVRTESCRMSGLNGTDATAGTHAVYGINSDVCKLQLQKGAAFQLIFPEWVPHVSPIQWANQVALNAQNIVAQPNLCFVLGEYGS